MNGKLNVMCKHRALRQTKLCGPKTGHCVFAPKWKINCSAYVRCESVEATTTVGLVRWRLVCRHLDGLTTSGVWKTDVRFRPGFHWMRHALCSSTSPKGSLVVCLWHSFCRVVRGTTCPATQRPMTCTGRPVVCQIHHTNGWGEIHHAS